MDTRGLDRRTLTDDHPGLGTAEQLVAREADKRGAGAYRAANRRLVRQQLELVGKHPRAHVVNHRHPKRAQRLDLDLFDETDRPEVRRVRSQQRARLRANRRPVVAQASAVSGPNLDQPRAGLDDHLGNPEGAPDLDQLATGDDPLPPATGERRGRAQSGRWTCPWREPRSPVARSSSRLLYPMAARATAARAAGASGARPRFVCTTTPVAFSTRRSEGSRRSFARASKSTSSSAPSSSSARRSARVARATAIASRSTDGRRRSASRKGPSPTGRRALIGPRSGEGGEPSYRGAATAPRL